MLESLKTSKNAENKVDRNHFYHFLCTYSDKAEILTYENIIKNQYK